MLLELHLLKTLKKYNGLKTQLDQYTDLDEEQKTKIEAYFA